MHLGLLINAAWIKYIIAQIDDGGSTENASDQTERRLLEESNEAESSEEGESEFHFFEITSYNLFIFVNLIHMIMLLLSIYPFMIKN